MTITAEKTWNFQQAIADESVVGQTNRTQLWNIKEGFITGSGAWTVSGSSNSTTAGMDSTDRWVSYLNVVYSTGAHSWIVLKNLSLGDENGLEVCFDCNYGSSSTENIDVIVSVGANFTGGTTSARPTASNEKIILSGLWSSSTNARYSTYVAKELDGDCTRVYVFRAGALYKVWFLDRPKNSNLYWDEKWYGAIAKTPSLTTFHDGAGITTTISNVSYTLFCALNGKMGDAGLSGMTAFSSPSYDRKYPVQPINFFLNSVTTRGMPGTAFDLWMTSETIVRSVAGSWNFAVLPPFVVPWTGSAPVT
jgi:hypothetical protein